MPVPPWFRLASLAHAICTARALPFRLSRARRRMQQFLGRLLEENLAVLIREADASVFLRRLDGHAGPLREDDRPGICVMRRWGVKADLAFGAAAPEHQARDHS